MKTYTPLFFLSLLLLSFGCSTPEAKKQPYVILVSLDAFRWDYPDMTATPGLDEIERRGVKAASMQPCFPTVTFPNHYSIATGQYPDNHGICLNSFYDPPTGMVYSIRSENRDNSYFYTGVPIWKTFEDNQILTASFYWVGSDIDGDNPTYWKPYKTDFPYRQRVDTVISWLKKPEVDRPHLALLYYPQPDAFGHEYGPVSDPTLAMATYVDSMVDYLISEVDKLPFSDEVNIIVVSDHGMDEVSPDRTVVIADVIPKAWVKHYGGSNPVYTLEIEPSKIDSAVELLSNTEHISAWRSELVPERLHFGKNPRTLDVTVLADSSWTLLLKPSKRGYSGVGAHGYDNENINMQSIFYAYGPAFKKGYTLPTLRNIDINPLICKIFSVEPDSAVDGSIEGIKGMLKKN